jgi:hypothetical protein
MGLLWLDNSGQFIACCGQGGPARGQIHLAHAINKLSRLNKIPAAREGNSEAGRDTVCRSGVEQRAIEGSEAVERREASTVRAALILRRSQQLERARCGECR